MSTIPPEQQPQKSAASGPRPETTRPSEENPIQSRIPNNQSTTHTTTSANSDKKCSIDHAEKVSAAPDTSPVAALMGMTAIAVFTIVFLVLSWCVYRFDKLEALMHAIPAAKVHTVTVTVSKSDWYQQHTEVIHGTTYSKMTAIAEPTGVWTTTQHIRESE
nr:hypothetical protein B0A51_15316 [Rachicladosporium sp. CCFEE 5018]